MDISFKVESQKFNYRVCAIIASDEKILTVYHHTPSPYYSPPGGRVKMGKLPSRRWCGKFRKSLV